MIIEGIVTTTNEDGTPQVSAMGPLVDPAITSLTLRPFESSTTLANLQRHRCGVFHVVDDVELLVAAALQTWDTPPQLTPATKIDGYILSGCCRWFEFEVQSIDTSAPRAEIPCRILERGHIRDAFGFNRAKHAVVEATILVTRLHLLPLEDVRSQVEQLQPLVEKTGGDAERRAWNQIARTLAAAERKLESTA